MTSNVLDRIEAIIASYNPAGDPATIEVRRQDRPYGDIGIFPRWDQASTPTIAGAVASVPEIASVKPSPSKLSVRLATFRRKNKEPVPLD